MTKPLLIVIVGPNAAGKSGLAVLLAKKFRGEIVSADSRQVYRGLDIGTGKITRSERQGIPHHLLDIADPAKQFDVAEFQRRARHAIRDIAGRGNIPFLVGGTGFWIDAVVYDLRLPAVPPNQELRKRLLEKKPAELFAILHRLDPKRANTIESKNPRRLIRAIEIARALGRVPKIKKREPYRALWLGITAPPNALAKRIRMRLMKRIRQGMVAEAKRLRVQGLAWRRFYALGLEYRFLADYLRGRISKTEMIAAIERANRHYARRQLRWFRRNPDIYWLREKRAAFSLFKKFLAQKTIGRET